jgi:predicted anti-sigma-YlaC factor YlaD
MHKIVIDEMERHLAGRASAAFYDHLAQCSDCRQKAEEMRQTALLLHKLRVPEQDELVLPAGFYARLASRIVYQQKSSAWGMFAPDALFFRRVAFGSLLLLAGLGSYLITNEAEFSVNDATAIIARQSAADNTDTADAPRHRDQILLTLANWSE